MIMIWMIGYGKECIGLILF